MERVRRKAPIPNCIVPDSTGTACWRNTGYGCTTRPGRGKRSSGLARNCEFLAPGEGAGENERKAYANEERRWIKVAQMAGVDAVAASKPRGGCRSPISR
jgi:hypothetical protein